PPRTARIGDRRRGVRSEGPPPPVGVAQPSFQRSSCPTPVQLLREHQPVWENRKSGCSQGLSHWSDLPPNRLGSEHAQFYDGTRFSTFDPRRSRSAPWRPTTVGCRLHPEGAPCLSRRASRS